MIGRGLIIAAVFAAMGYVGAGIAQAPTEQRIELVAVKYDFNPPEIRVKRGVSVRLILTSPDFPHGFGIPDFKRRVDLIPGKPVELVFTPDRAGKFPFLCDNFCGEGHDRMSGFIIVEQ
jgi:cytochrome c oxidase subunit 2